MAKPIRYGKMKDSGIKWIGNIPTHWSLRLIKYMFSIKKDIAGHEGYTVLSVTQKGIVPKKMSDKGQFAQDYSKYQLVHVGDFVMNHMDLLTGWIDVSPFEGVTSPDYRVFTNDSPNVYDSEYYKYIFQHCYKNRVFYGFGQGVSGFGRWRLPADMFLNFHLPVPPIGEQKIIAAYLDDQSAQIESLVAEAKECIDDYKKWRAAIIFEAVTKGLNPGVKFRKCRIEWINHIPEHWDTVRFVMYNWIRARLGWKGLKSEEYVDEGYPFLSAFNIVDNHLYWTPLNFVNQDRYDESPEIKISIGDILLVKDGAGIGKCARVDELPLGESTVNSSLAVITPNDKFDYKYEFYYLLGNVFQNIIARLRNGMGVPHLTQEAMKAIFVPVPTLDEQRQIAAYLDEKCAAIDEIIAEKESLIADLESYKKSLIYETVTGKRKVAGS